MLRVSIFAPVSGTRNPKRWDTVVPERLNVGLALNEDDVPRLPRLSYAVQPIQLGLGARLPAEAVTLKRNPEPNRKQFAAGPEIRNANGWCSVVCDLGEAVASQELD